MIILEYPRQLWSLYDTCLAIWRCFGVLAATSSARPLQVNNQPWPSNSNTNQHSFSLIWITRQQSMWVFGLWCTWMTFGVAALASPGSHSKSTTHQVSAISSPIDTRSHLIGSLGSSQQGVCRLLCTRLVGWTAFSVAALSSRASHSKSTIHHVSVISWSIDTNSHLIG